MIESINIILYKHRLYIALNTELCCIMIATEEDHKMWLKASEIKLGQ